MPVAPPELPFWRAQRRQVALNQFMDKLKPDWDKKLNLDIGNYLGMLLILWEQV